MNQGTYVFSQLLALAVRYQFNQCVARYRGERGMKHLTCWEQFLALVFGQLAGRKSLRDIVVCLMAHRNKLYHLGFRSLMRRSTLADANERRDWRIYRDFASLLIAEARTWYARTEIETLALAEAVYVIDATTIELCLALFPWARLPHQQAAIKLQVGLELHGNIPAFFAFTGGKTPDVFFLDQVAYETGAYYVVDRGYVDFGRFYCIHASGAYFITRAKVGWSFRRLYSRPVDKRTGVRCDQVGVEGRHHHRKKYPAHLRRVKYYNALTRRSYVFVTNNFELPATVIAELYKQRWQVELFFKWIKQHLAIESFWGRSANAVKTQICSAIATYLLVAILKKHLRIDRNTYEILQILSISLFDKIPIIELIANRPTQLLDTPIQKQAQLWEF